MESLVDNDPPWPEWSDAEVNAEKWSFIDGTGKSAKGTGATTKSTAKQKMELPENYKPFEDPSGHGVLPPNFKAFEWKRPNEINPNISFTVLPTNITSDIFSKNSHLLGCRTMQRILIVINALEKRAEKNPFQIEFQGPKFQVPVNVPWKPWHHVYSLNKIGKGVPHKPEYNSYGKYVVRVFHVGKWRKILVDDYFPIDSKGTVLLPIAKDPRELWLPILSKALLRAVYHSERQSVVSELTGWILLQINCASINQAVLWEALVRNVKGGKNEPSKPENDPKMCVTRGSVQCINNDISFSGTAALASLLKKDRDDTHYYAKYATVEEVCEDESHVSATQEIQVKRWKQFRWKRWAVEHGIIKDVDKSPGRKVLLFGPMSWLPVNADECIPEKSENEPIPDNQESKWFYLYDLIENLGLIYVFFSPSQFEYRYNVLDVNDILFPPEDKKGGGKKGDKSTASSGKSNKSKAPVIQRPSHCSGRFYLISDSLFCKTVYVMLDGDILKTGDVTGTGIHLVAEQFSWKLTGMGKFLFSFNTFEPSSVALFLGAGLQAVRMWYNLPYHYSIQVYSKAPFTLTNKERAQELLSLPSVTENACANASVSAFKALMEDHASVLLHGQALKCFVDSLQPFNINKQLKSWNEKFDIRMKISIAVEELVTEMTIFSLGDKSFEVLKKTLLTFRKLFLNPQFGTNFLRTLLTDFPQLLSAIPALSGFSTVDEVLEQLLEVEISEEKPATDAKKPAKKTPAKSPKKDTSKYENMLLDVPENIIRLFRKIIEKFPEIQKYFSFNDCVESQLCYIDYRGSTDIKMSENTLFLIRYVFNVVNINPMPYSFHVYTTMKHLILHIIDNDSREELISGLIENNTYCLAANQLGYTVFAYGNVDDSALAPKQNDIPWKLRILGTVEHKLPYSFSPFQDAENQPPPRISLLQFEGLYLPDKDNVFCRCVLNIKKNVLVTLHLVASSDISFITLQVKGNRQNILASAGGVHEIIIPVLFLDCEEGIPSIEGNGVIFAIEGHVEKDSWVLSEESKAALRHIKELRNEAGLKRLGKSSKKSSLSNEPGAELVPFWLLTAVINSDEIPNCQLLPDTQSEDEIRRQKEDWITGDEQHRLEGIEARNLFLSQYPQDYFHGPPSLSVKTSSKESICLASSVKSEMSITEYPVATRTESLIHAHSLKSEDKVLQKEPSEEALQMPEEALHTEEETQRTLQDEIRTHKLMEEHLSFKFEISERDTLAAKENMKAIVQQTYQSLAPQKPQSKKGDKSTPASKK